MGGIVSNPDVLAAYSQSPPAPGSIEQRDDRRRRHWIIGVWAKISGVWARFSEDEDCDSSDFGTRTGVTKTKT